MNTITAPHELKTAHQNNDGRLVKNILEKYGLLEIEDHTFFRTLNDKSNVLDLGGWRGNFAEKIKNTYGCKVDVFEPNKSQVEILDRRFSDDVDVMVYPFAIGGAREIVKFYPSPEYLPGQEKGSSLFVESPYVDESLSYDVQKIPLADVRDVTGVENYDLIKMDIEGAELEVFEDQSSVDFLCGAKMLTIEFHYKMPMNDKILIPKVDIERMISILVKAGFRYLDFGRNFKYIDCLFYKE